MTMPNDHEHAVCGEVLIVRLKRQAESASQVSKMMAEAKSRRQDDGSRSDLYSWSTPEQTLEYQAAEHIAALTAEVERVRAETIEAAARVAEANAETSISLMRGLGASAHIEIRRHRAGIEIATAIRTEIRALAGEGAGPA